MPPMSLGEKEQKQIRAYLQGLFEQKLTKNPSYSLRAFAKSLNVHPGTLGQILSGQRPVTKRRLRNLALSLNESPESFFEIVKDPSTDPKELSVDLFSVISEWYYDAILEITRLGSFQPTLKWVSKALGININIVKSSVDRLKSLKLLVVGPDGSWTDSQPRSRTKLGEYFTNLSMQRYQKGILEQSLDSLSHFPRGSRDHLSVIVAMDDALVDRVHEKIKEFASNLSDFVEENSVSKDNVRVIHFGSFPITNLSNNKESKNEVH